MRVGSILHEAGSAGVDRVYRWLATSWLAGSNIEKSVEETLGKFIDTAQETVGKSDIKRISKDYITSIWREGRKPERIFPQRTREAIGTQLGAPDYEAINYLSRVDPFFASRYVEYGSPRANEIKRFLSEEFLEKGKGLGESQWARDEFKSRFGDLVDRIGERAARVIVDTGVSRARNWSATLSMVENGVAKYRISNPWDRITCPYCKAMRGKVLDVKIEKKRIDSVIEDGREDISQFDRFLNARYAGAEGLERLKTISPEDLQKGDALPPFHGNCRCSVVADVDSLFEPQTTPEPIPTVQPKPAEDKNYELIPGAKYNPKTKQIEYEKVDWKNRGEFDAWQRSIGVMPNSRWFAGVDIKYINEAMRHVRYLMPHMNTDFGFLTEVAVHKGKIPGQGRALGCAWWSRNSWKEMVSGRIALKQRISRTERSYDKTRQTLIKSLKSAAEQYRFFKNDPYWNGEDLKPVCDRSKANLLVRIRDISKKLRGGDLRPTYSWSTSDAAVNDLAGVMMHELGHIWHYTKEKEAKQYLGLDYELRSDRAKPHPSHVTSQYSKTDTAEALTEAFSLYCLGRMDEVPEGLFNFFEKHTSLKFGEKLKKLGVTWAPKR